MDKKRKKSEPTHIGVILKETLKNFNIDFKIKEYKIWDIWDNIVGPSIAKNAQPSFYKNKILFVSVTDSTWMSELHFMKEGLIKELNDAIGETFIEDMRFAQTGKDKSKFQSSKFK